MRKELMMLGDKVGFHICKRISSQPEVIEDIPENDRLPTTKILGVLWSTKDVMFFFVYSSPSSPLKLQRGTS
ncbi:Hypothetical predicted protein [Paramuricea clavata]|uniref:Uncharacterized protein n=1 Tax=Paramuricea clavata TaxID=317549 RepID=A0A7D9HMH9_PARCT|nr:Hypothetical predicted protein [Paramuricea clavata]